MEFSYCTYCKKSYKNGDAIYKSIDLVIMNINKFESWIIILIEI